MKKIIVAIIISIATLSCSNEPTKESVTALAENSNTNAKSAAPANTSAWGDYKIDVTVSIDGTEWTYTITRAKSTAKNLSHFILNLNNCGVNSPTFADIQWATVNGNPADLLPTEGVGTTCDPQAITTNFVKFNNLQPATSWVLVMKLDHGYDNFENGNAWIKAGTSCNQGLITAPGCPKTVERCKFGQGYFFANGSDRNGAQVLWGDGLTIGGIKYTLVQGNTIWSIDTGRGGDQTLNAFFQLGVVRLNGDVSSNSAKATIIDTYFYNLNILKTLVTISAPKPYSYYSLPEISNGISKAQVVEAGIALINQCK